MKLPEGGPIESQDYPRVDQLRASIDYISFLLLQLNVLLQEEYLSLLEEISTLPPPLHYTLITS